MSEAYGYYTYGDEKAKHIVGSSSYGIKKLDKDINLISKEVNCYIKTLDKDLTYSLLTSVSKNVFAGNFSLHKSANGYLQYVSNLPSTTFDVEIIDNTSYSINLENSGYYEIVTEGQVSKYNVNISAEPSNATIKINGVEQNTYIAYDTEEIEYEISLDTYCTKKNKIKITKDENLQFTLLPTIHLTIIPSIEDATVVIAGIERREYTGELGEIVHYTITKHGYKTVNADIELTEDTVLNVELISTIVHVNYPTTDLPTTVTTSGIGPSSSYAFYRSSSRLYSSSGSYNINSGKSYAYLKFTTPTVETTLSIRCYVSSESNYDFGAIWVGNTSVQPSQSSVKSGTAISGGEYLYRNSGNTSYTTVTKVLAPNTTYYINLIYVKDGSGNTNSDRFYISNIEFDVLEE